jgi:hypothetical protein
MAFRQDWSKKRSGFFSTFLRGCNPDLLNRTFQISPLSCREDKTIL